MHPSNKWDILHFNSWKILNEFLFLDLQKDFIFLRDCNKLHPAYDVGWLAMSYFSLFNLLFLYFTIAEFVATNYSSKISFD